MKKSNSMYLVISSLVIGNILILPLTDITTILPEGNSRYIISAALAALVSFVISSLLPVESGMKILYDMGMHFFGLGIMVLGSIIIGGLFGLFTTIFWYTLLIFFASCISFIFLIKIIIDSN